MDQIRSLLSLVADDANLQALLVVTLSVIAGKLVDLLLCRVILRLARKTRNEFDDRILSLTHRPIFISVVLIGLTIALHLVAPDEPSRLVGTSILGTLAILLWTAYGFRITEIVLQALCAHEDRFECVQPGTITLFHNLCRVVLVGGGLYLLLVCWRIDVTGWFASAGIIGVAVGFAARDTIANFISGVFILTDAPYKHGDFVILDEGERGRVTHIGIRSTRLLTRDDIEITIPNAVIGNAKIINETGGRWEKERVRITISVAYGSDIDIVKETLVELATRQEGVCDEPKPRVRFREFGDSGLVLQLLGWIEEPVLRGRIVDALNTSIYKRFAEAGIEIPYAKQDLYIKEMPSRSGAH